VSHTDPTLKDTDYDGLDDKEESEIGMDGYVTNGEDADTDSDGITDSTEKYQWALKSNQRKNIPDANQTNSTQTNSNQANSNQTNSTHGAQSIFFKNVNIANVVSAEARYGVSHERVGDLAIKLKYSKGNTIYEKSIKTKDGNGNKTFYGSCVLDETMLSYLDDGGDFGFVVYDEVVGNKGAIDYFEIWITQRTNPNNYDSDCDGLNDSEEFGLGDDGWITNPLKQDTDGDSLNDYEEVKGTVKGVTTNPTNVDTDEDGYNDNVDVDPLHDIVVKLWNTTFVINDSVGSGSVEVCYVWKIDTGSGWINFPSKWENYQATVGEENYILSSFYYNLPDNLATLTMEYELWWKKDGEPHRFDISPDNNSREFSQIVDVPNMQSYLFEDRHYETIGNPKNDEKGASFSFDILFQTLNRNSVTLINATDSEIYVTPEGYVQHDY
jgi:hypothetical protein